MNTLRPPVKTIADRLAEQCGGDRIHVHEGVFGRNIEIRCDTPDTWAVVLFNRRADRPRCVISHYRRPSSEWRFDDTDPITERPVREFDYGMMTTTAVVDMILREIR